VGNPGKREVCAKSYLSLIFSDVPGHPAASRSIPNKFLARDIPAAKLLRMKTTTTTTKIPELGALELRQRISLVEAAKLNNVSPATFRRTYGHLFQRIGKRRLAITLADAINLPPPPRG
jgi:hypothetical protein